MIGASNGHFWNTGIIENRNIERWFPCTIDKRGGEDYSPIQGGLSSPAKVNKRSYQIQTRMDKVNPQKGTLP